MRLQEPVMLQPVATSKPATAARLTNIDRMGWFPPDPAGCDRPKPLQPAAPDVANLHLSVRLQYLPGLVDVKSEQRLSGACSAIMLLEYHNTRDLESGGVVISCRSMNTVANRAGMNSRSLRDR